MYGAYNLSNRNKIVTSQGEGTRNLSVSIVNVSPSRRAGVEPVSTRNLEKPITISGHLKAEGKSNAEFIEMRDDYARCFNEQNRYYRIVRDYEEIDQCDSTSGLILSTV